MVNLFNEPDARADIAVVGLGPGGLAAAYRAAEKGLNVVAFTNRKQYEREQQLFVSPKTYHFLESIQNKIDYKGSEKAKREDELFLSNILLMGFKAKTKDIETYIYKRLEKMPKVTIIKAIKDSVQDIKTISPGSGADYIELKNGEKFYFKHLLGADGAKHGVAEMVRVGLKKKDVEYLKSDQQERHLYHGVVQLRVKPGGRESEKKVRGIKVANLGWEQPFMPKKYVFSNEDKNEFSFAGEIPKAVFEATQNERSELMRKWAAAAVKEDFGFDEDDLEINVGGAMPITTFKMEMIEQQSPLISLQQGGQFGCIGDARRTPNYNLGHGMNDAVSGGLLFADSISNHTDRYFDSSNYVTGLKALDREVELGMCKKTKEEEDSRNEAKIELLTKITEIDGLLKTSIKKLSSTDSCCTDT